MKSSLRTPVVVLLGLLVVQIASEARADPSFDCGRASTRVERMICDHPHIARLDSELADAYRIALRDSPWASANRRIRAEQQDWLAQRNQCGNVGCLQNLYKRRIKALRAEVGDAGGGSDGNSGGGRLVRVRGVAANDVLNVRAGPGANHRIVGALGNGDRVKNLGCESDDGSRWCRIEMLGDMGGRGWVNARYLDLGGQPDGNDGLRGTPGQFDAMVEPCIAQAARLTGTLRHAVTVLERIRTGGGPILTLSAAGAKYTCRREANGRVTVFSEYAN